MDVQPGFCVIVSVRASGRFVILVVLVDAERLLKGLLIFLMAAAAIWYLLRHLRRREITAFLDEDIADFQSFAVAREGQSGESENALSGLEPKALDNGFSGATTTKPLADLSPVSPGSAAFVLKDGVFDEETRNMLTQLHKVLPESIRLFMNVPLSEFVRRDSSVSRSSLDGHRVAFLLCDAEKLNVVAGIQFGDMFAGPAGEDFVKHAFRDIGRPLVEFPFTADISRLEIEGKLGEHLRSQVTHRCPKCGSTMAVRRAARGKNAGKFFRVCQRFPECRGATKV